MQFYVTLSAKIPTLNPRNPFLAPTLCRRGNSYVLSSSYFCVTAAVIALPFWRSFAEWRCINERGSHYYYYYYNCCMFALYFLYKNVCTVTPILLSMLLLLFPHVVEAI